jgi:hypothetical protein
LPFLAGERRFTKARRRRLPTLAASHISRPFRPLGRWRLAVCGWRPFRPQSDGRRLPQGFHIGPSGLWGVGVRFGVRRPVTALILRGLSRCFPPFHEGCYWPKMRSGHSFPSWSGRLMDEHHSQRDRPRRSKAAPGRRTPRSTPSLGRFASVSGWRSGGDAGRGGDTSLDISLWIQRVVSASDL